MFLVLHLDGGRRRRHSCGDGHLIVRRRIPAVHARLLAVGSDGDRHDTSAVAGVVVRRGAVHPEECEPVHHVRLRGGFPARMSRLQQIREIRANTNGRIERTSSILSGPKGRCTSRGSRESSCGADWRSGTYSTRARTAGRSA